MSTFVKSKVNSFISPSLSRILISQGIEVGNTLNCPQKKMFGAIDLNPEIKKVHLVVRFFV